MKSTKEMQLKSNNQVKKEARETFASVNTNPAYIFRKMNKLAEGKDSDFNDISKEGISKEAVCEQYNRLQEAAKCGGYWWGSVIARHGYIITGAKKVEIDAPLYVAKGGEVITEVINGTLYSLKAAAAWNYTNVVASAALFLKFKEEAAKESGALYSWQKVQATAKAQAMEARKAEAKKARKAASEARKAEATRTKELAMKVQALKAQVKDGTLSQEEAARQLAAIVAA